MIRQIQTLGFFAALSVMIPAAVAAQSEFEKQLADLTGGDESGAPAQSGWILPELEAKTDGATGPCAMSYRDGTNSIGYIAPSAHWDESYFFVAGGAVPLADKTRSVRATLATDGDADQTVKAFHVPINANRSAILFKLTDFAAALDAIEDVEDIAVVLMEPDDQQYRQAIFSGRWTGGHAARDRLRLCLAETGRETSK